MDEHADNRKKIADAPSTFRADMRQHFSFQISSTDRGEKDTDKQKQFANTAGRWSTTLQETHQT